MLRFRSDKPVFRLLGCFMAILLAAASSLYWAQATPAQPSQKRLVFFTADWCASCREVLPVLERLANEQHWQLLTINVEEGSAPKEASSAGLQIPQKELPQVYLLEASKSKLLFDGTGYHMRLQESLEQDLRKQLAL